MGGGENDPPIETAPPVESAPAAAGSDIPEDFVTKQAYNSAALAQIQAETEKQPLLSELEPLDSLEAEYLGGDPVFMRKIGELRETYAGIRRVRGDGNCFIRSYIFGFLENVLISSNFARFDTFVAKLNENLDRLSELGYDRDTAKDFVDDLVEVTQQIRGGKLNREQLAERFRNPMLQGSIIFCARLMASCYLQLNADGFQPFIEDGRSVRQFCLEEVEPLDRDVEQLQIIAMTCAMEIGVRIENLDLSAGRINHHDFPEGSSPEVFQLYRPGHYDLLARREA